MFGLVSCAVGPDYERPEVESPNAWRFVDADARDTANIRWWEQFDDPVLDDLINSALQENLDVRIAAARIEEFVGRLRSTRSGFFPQFGYDARGSRERTTEAGAVPLPPGLDPVSNSYSAVINMSWEIDLWGKLRRATEASRADLLATEEARRAVILSLVSAVANSYVTLRDLDKRLEIAQRTLDSREQMLRLFEKRYQGGVVSELELSQVHSEYAQALAEVPARERDIALLENAIAVLLGRNPGAITRGKTIDELTLPPVPEALPSQVLEQRPDIRQAEQNLIAANARIGVARARYFPTISLTGFFGSVSAALSDLFTSPAQVWNYGGSIAGPIFTGGAIAGEVQQAEARQKQALLAYQQAIQSAFREVEDALIDHEKSREQLEAQRERVEALENYARLAKLRYDNGYTSYLEVLESERSLFSAELAYAQNQGAVYGALVDIYKAVGGGWVVQAEQIAGPALPEDAPASAQPTSDTPGDPATTE
ncbi:MAG: efflux transporter outer membrane subunit [Pseudomonadota bacterium]|nr:MAG: efflux transporter outer membrane subunit [Pseudomonadota bacterium]